MGTQPGKNEFADSDPDVDHLEAGPREFTAGERHGLLRAMLVVVVLMLAVVPGSVSVLARDFDHQAGSAPSETPRETVPRIIVDTSDGRTLETRISILERPRADRDALAGWAAAQVSPNIAKSARLAITYEDVQIFVAASGASPCLLIVDDAGHRALGDCVTSSRLLVSAGNDRLSVSAVAVGCAFDVVLIPDDYHLRLPWDAALITEGPNVAIVRPGDSSHGYRLQSKGKATATFAASNGSRNC